VPVQPTPFFGRQPEIAELIDCLTNPSCRLVTLVGAGGAGKTRLALEVGARLHSRIAGGVCFVPLPPQASPVPLALAAATVAAAVTDALQAPLLDSADPTAQLVAHLAGKQLLLILDNYEHLLAAGGATLRGLSTLATCATFICFWPASCWPRDDMWLHRAMPRPPMPWRLRPATAG
jgi:predicted ATPase